MQHEIVNSLKPKVSAAPFAWVTAMALGLLAAAPVGRETPALVIDWVQPAWSGNAAPSMTCNSRRRELRFGMITLEDEPMTHSAAPMVCLAVYVQ
jgi:hypothetical protein